MLRAKIKTKKINQWNGRCRDKTEKNGFKRTKDGPRDTKTWQNMIQIIVLNIAKCNYQQQHAACASICTVDEPQHASVETSATFADDATASHNHFHLFLRLSLVEGAETFISFFVFNSSNRLFSTICIEFSTHIHLSMLEKQSQWAGPGNVDFYINKFNRNIKQQEAKAQDTWLSAHTTLDGWVRIHGDSRPNGVGKIS